MAGDLIVGKVAELFTTGGHSAADSAPVGELRSRYVIAITPRSGSSYLCDVIKKAQVLGRPDEVINQNFIPEILKRTPASNADSYARAIFWKLRSPDGVSGIKASWFQFQNFLEAMDDPTWFNGCRFIYLTRRDLVAQAVSLYLATESNVFHTNIQHSPEALEKQKSLPYNFSRIEQWRAHIAAQELGWQRYFAGRGIVPLCISYEQIEEDIDFVVRRMAQVIGVNPAAIKLEANASVFRKLADQRNLDWAQRFRAESKNLVAV